MVSVTEMDENTFLRRQGTVFQVMRFSVKDGPGIRTTVFLKGCPLRCVWCHNPESQRLEPEPVFRKERCVRCGACHDLPTDEQKAEACPAEARGMIGRSVTVADVMKKVLRDVSFYDESGGGVTFSGGEPLMQPEFLEGLLGIAHRHSLNTAVDTCGLAPTETVIRLAEHVDLWLYDLKAMDETRHRELTGATNKLILANLAELARRGKYIRIRLPLAPGKNDDEANLVDTAKFMLGLGLRDLGLLPFHSEADAKYKRLKRTNPVDGWRDCTPEQAEAAAGVLRAAGLNVRIGS